MKISFLLKTSLLIAVIVSVTFTFSCKNKTKMGNNTEEMEKELQEFICELESQTKPLFKDVGIASWDASISGKKEDYAKTEELSIKITNIFADKGKYETLKRIKKTFDPNCVLNPGKLGF